ncbi:MAG: multidrug ABC transporter ATP-binding protein [Micrococcales bacterium 73-13]|nr:MAG: multidrug ABC transporter ATP-binding protein [Micrococcales bacterium 73-13]
MRLIRIITRFLRPYAGLVVGVVVFQLVQAIANLLLPSLNADIIDNGIAKGDIGRILTIGAIMLGGTLVQIAAAIAAVWFGAGAAMRLGRDMRERIFVRVAEFSEREVGRFGAPSLITRTTNDVQQIQMLVFMFMALIISAPITAIGGIIMALQQDVGLSWLMAVAVPVLLVVIGFIVVRMVPQFRRMQSRIDSVNRILREQLTGIRVIRAFVRERHEAERFAVANAELADTALRVGRLFAIVFPLVMLMMNGTSVAVLWFGAAGVDAGTTQIGALTAFLQYLIQILMAVMMAVMMSMMVPRAAVAAERIGEVLDTESSVVPPSAPVKELSGEGSVEFRDVEFRYPGAEEPVLSGISFRARPGTTTAIIGSTGSGKTTLVGLVPRLFDATGGAVLIDGVDVREIDPDLLWGRVGLVPQRAYLFSGTVASNLRFGKPDATDEELWAALRTAQAEDFVRAMPEGLDSPIAQGGTNVSGGQRQRLAIARALVKRAPVLVFDDSFSALDTATDARLRAALAVAEADVTRIVVAQRVSTILDADEILVVDDGRIVARGTHEELLESSETYREIVDSQLRVDEEAA